MLMDKKVSTRRRLTKQVSVITVCFNAEATIERCLESVRKQRNASFEHIVIDGGSSDRTIDILKSYFPHERNWISETDRGIYDAMNKGAARARGEIITFLNADDFYASDDVLAAVLETTSTEDWDILSGDVDIFRPHSMSVTRRYRADHFTLERLHLGWMPPHPATFLRKDLFDELDGFKPYYKIAGDFEFCLRAFLSRHAKYQSINKTFTMMQGGGASSGGWKSRRTLRKEINLAFKENQIRVPPFLTARRYLDKAICQICVFNARKI